MNRLPVLAVCIALGAVPPAAAISTKYWIHDTAAELLQGETEGVSVTSDGTLVLAPEIGPVAEPEVPYVWDLAASRDGGTLYLGTGDEGWVLRVRGDDAEEHFQCAALEVLSVVVGPDGAVYAGTAAEGFIYRIDGKDSGRVLFDAEESYVWDLAFGPDGKLYAAVGPGGAVYRIDPGSGDAERIFTTKESHVVCLAFDEEGRLLLGTEGRGLVVRVDRRGKATVLYDTPRGEVGAVMAGENGAVWAAAAAAQDSREGARQESSAQADGPDGEKGNGPDRGDRFSDPFLFEITDDGDGDGVLYRIDTEGNALRVWSSGQGAIFDLARGPDGSVIAVTGDEGAVYRVDPDGSATLLLDAPEEQVASVVSLPGERGWAVATANPSRVYRIGERAREEGTYTSDVLDARHVASWGRAEWEGEENGGRVRLSVRAGNTDEPDDTWSDWQELEGNGPSWPVDRKGVRFLQWRVRLSRRGGEGPAVRRVRVASLENNLPPLVSGVEVVPAGNRFYEEMPEVRPRPLYQALPGGVNVQYQFEQGGDAEFPPEHRAPWTQGLRQVRWEAVDPNGDGLIFHLAFRREDEKRWKQFAKDVEGKNYTFTANGVPDGSYRIRVTADDSRSNPGTPKTVSAVSETFLVDNTAPGFDGVEHRRDGESVRITGSVVDAMSDVIRFEYSVNGDDWVDRAPADGIFDSTQERIDVSVTAPPGEEHSVLLRGTDNAGNLGATRVLIRP